MRKTIGVRREDKNKWKKRVPLIPADVKELYERFGITTIVQPSDIRIFPDEAYNNANAYALGSDQGRTPANRE